MSHGLMNRVVMSLCATFLIALQGCVSTEERDARLVAEPPECAAGEVLQCLSTRMGKVSDGRFGHLGTSGKNCTCESTANLERMRGADLPPDQQPH